MSAPQDRRLRAVIDTSVLLSALVFSHGKMALLRHAWQLRRFVPVCNRDTVAELTRVLAYPKFRLSPPEQHKLLTDYLPYIETHTNLLPAPTTLPLCRDPQDQKFLDLAHSAQVEYLVSGDADLLILNDALSAQHPFRIVTAHVFAAKLPPR